MRERYQCTCCGRTAEGTVEELNAQGWKRRTRTKNYRKESGQMIFLSERFVTPETPCFCIVIPMIHLHIFFVASSQFSAMRTFNYIANQFAGIKYFFALKDNRRVHPFFTVFAFNPNDIVFHGGFINSRIFNKDSLLIKGHKIVKLERRQS